MTTTNATGRQFSSNWTYSSKVSKLLGVFALIAVVGWLVSTLLTAIHLFALPAIPSDAQVAGSIQVITSPWAYVFGIPLATLGAVYYLTTIGFVLWWFDTKHPLILKVLTPITASGVMASAYFVWLQLVPIGAICPFCMVSAAASVMLFGLELGVLYETTSPPFDNLFNDLSNLVTQTNLAVVILPILMGIVSLGGLFIIPLLPLPDPVPFV